VGWRGDPVATPVEGEIAVTSASSGGIDEHVKNLCVWRCEEIAKKKEEGN
jgi:hypothetical protein